MALHEAQPHENSPGPPDKSANPITRLSSIIGQATSFVGDAYGLDKGERAALARLDPDGDLRPHQIAALTRALISAGLEPESWRPETWRRWALIAHGMALAGQDGRQSLGQQLFNAQVAESRVNRLLTARGDAFRQLLPRILRLLASREVTPNWYELGGLILQEGRDEKKAEAIRLKIAGRYFSAQAQANQQQTA